jgi:hypothetical protein
MYSVPPTWRIQQKPRETADKQLLYKMADTTPRGFSSPPSGLRHANHRGKLSTEQLDMNIEQEAAGNLGCISRLRMFAHTLALTSGKNVGKI